MCSDSAYECITAHHDTGHKSQPWHLRAVICSVEAGLHVQVTRTAAAAVLLPAVGLLQRLLTSKHNHYQYGSVPTTLNTELPAAEVRVPSAVAGAVAAAGPPSIWYVRCRRRPRTCASFIAAEQE